MNKPPAKSPQELEVELQAALGRALFAWGRLELTLSILFRAVLSPTSPVVADGIFGSIRAFDARLGMVGAAVVGTFSKKDDPINIVWSGLSRRCDSQAKMRNKLAHATALMVDGTTPVLEPFFLISKSRPRISTSEIDACAVSFWETSRALMWLEDRVAVRKGMRHELPPELRVLETNLVADLLRARARA